VVISASSAESVGGGSEACATQSAVSLPKSAPQDRVRQHMSKSTMLECAIWLQRHEEGEIARQKKWRHRCVHTGEEKHQMWWRERVSLPSMNEMVHIPMTAAAGVR
jgi:hypothetical protein